MQGIGLIIQERHRQIYREGFNSEHDDKHESGEILGAAKTYLQQAWSQLSEDVHPPQVDGYGEWPWGLDWWKPSDDPIRNLVKAGALIAAEIDKLQRAGEKQ